jgi:hypothetical protein
MVQLFSNNAISSLSAGITAVDTTLVFSVGDGGKFNAPTGGDFELLALYDGATIDVSTNIEIVKMTARTGDTATIVRGQEGTSGFAFSASAGIEANNTAGTLDALKEMRAGLVKGATEFIHTMTTAAVDVTNGIGQSRTLAGNETLTFAIAAGQSVYITVIPGANTLTLTNVDEWVGGSAPATIEAEHAFVFWSDDGVTITGNSIGGIS